MRPELQPPGRMSLAHFSGGGYDKGRGPIAQTAWMLVSGLVFTRWWCPASLRVTILRAFGATVGEGVLIRHRVRIHWPWKLTLGDASWVGEQAWLLNLEPIVIGSNTCVSQDVLLCTGSHDRHSPTFEFDNAPITIGDRVWIGARATVLRGVSIGVGLRGGGLRSRREGRRRGQHRACSRATDTPAWSRESVRVVHAVTLITPDGAFGGPVRVAVNQARELQTRGHDVEIVAACSGYAGRPANGDG